MHLYPTKTVGHLSFPSSKDCTPCYPDIDYDTEFVIHLVAHALQSNPPLTSISYTAYTETVYQTVYISTYEFWYKVSKVNYFIYSFLICLNTV